MGRARVRRDPFWATSLLRMQAHAAATVTHDGKVWTLAHSNALPGWEPGAAGMHDVWKEVP